MLKRSISVTKHLMASILNIYFPVKCLFVIFTANRIEGLPYWQNDIWPNLLNETWFKTLSVPFTRGSKKRPQKWQSIVIVRRREAWEICGWKIVKRRKNIQNRKFAGRSPVRAPYKQWAGCQNNHISFNLVCELFWAGWQQPRSEKKSHFYLSPSVAAPDINSFWL